MTHDPAKPMPNLAKRGIENFIFNIKWVLILFYVGLVAALGLYGYAYVIHLCSLFTHMATIEEMKIILLDLVDVVMVANLVKMIITGSYHSFVCKDHGREGGTSSGTLKVKIASSILVVCMINLLRTFVSDPTGMIPWEVLTKQLAIFGAFLVATITLGKLESWHEEQEKNNHG
jgi:uncharacterized protein (TIGR00645 family)